MKKTVLVSLLIAVGSPGAHAAWLQTCLGFLTLKRPPTITTPLINPSVVDGLNVVPHAQVSRVSWQDIPNRRQGFRVPAIHVVESPTPWERPQGTDLLLNCVGVAFINRADHTQALVHFFSDSNHAQFAQQFEKVFYQLGPEMIRKSQMYLIPGIDMVSGQGFPARAVRTFQWARKILENKLAELGHDPKQGWLWWVDTGLLRGENRIVIYKGRFIVPIEGRGDFGFAPYRSGVFHELIDFPSIVLP